MSLNGYICADPWRSLTALIRASQFQYLRLHPALRRQNALPLVAGVILRNIWKNSLKLMYEHINEPRKHPELSCMEFLQQDNVVVSFFYPCPHEWRWELLVECNHTKWFLTLFTGFVTPMRYIHLDHCNSVNIIPSLYRDLIFVWFDIIEAAFLF